MLDDGEPAAGARLVQGAVASVVSVVHVTHSVLQAVQDHLLKKGRHRGRAKFSLRQTPERRSLPGVLISPPQEVYRGVSSDLCTGTCIAPVMLPSTHTHTERVAHLHINAP